MLQMSVNRDYGLDAIHAVALSATDQLHRWLWRTLVAAVLTSGGFRVSRLRGGSLGVLVCRTRSSD